MSSTILSFQLLQKNINPGRISVKASCLSQIFLERESKRTKKPATGTYETPLEGKMNLTRFEWNSFKAFTMPEKCLELRNAKIFVATSGSRQQFVEAQTSRFYRNSLSSRYDPPPCVRQECHLLRDILLQIDSFHLGYIFPH